MSAFFDPNAPIRDNRSEVAEIQSILERLHSTMQMDERVQKTTDRLRQSLQSDRVVLYYFYKEWEGRVTYESLSHNRYTIWGSSGPDECFTGEYATLYLDGRVSAIADIETADIAPCHRDFLREIDVRANLVAPILTGTEQQNLWGLLVAHHCQAPKVWTEADIEQMKKDAAELAQASSIRAE